jgi:hypothetical protein
MDNYILLAAPPSSISSDARSSEFRRDGNRIRKCQKRTDNNAGHHSLSGMPSAVPLPGTTGWPTAPRASSPQIRSSVGGHVYKQRVHTLPSLRPTTRASTSASAWGRPVRTGHCSPARCRQAASRHAWVCSRGPGGVDDRRSGEACRMQDHLRQAVEEQRGKKILNAGRPRSAGDLG